MSERLRQTFSRPRPAGSDPAVAGESSLGPPVGGLGSTSSTVASLTLGSPLPVPPPPPPLSTVSPAKESKKKSKKEVAAAQLQELTARLAAVELELACSRSDQQLAARTEEALRYVCAVFYAHPLCARFTFTVSC
jgi:hypothetical protein